MKNKLALSVALLVLAVVTTHALTIKLGSLAPAQSPWDVSLRRIAAEWARISGGEVTLRVFAGGVAGDEPDMVRKIRIGELGAAAITVSGLQGIFNGFKVLSFPLFVRDDSEFVSTLARMQPFFDQELEKRGFKALMWSTGGWVYFFSRNPIVTPDDLRKQKIWVWVGDPAEVQAWQGAGFHVVPLASTDIMTGLQSGMIDALVSSPLLAAANQWFGVTRFMCGLKLAPLWGAAVVSTKAWEKVRPELRSPLLDAAQRAAEAAAPEIARADREAISVMKKYGLTVTEVPDAAQAQWKAILDKGFAQMIGSSLDRASYEMAEKYVEEYRAAHPAR